MDNDNRIYFVLAWPAWEASGGFNDLRLVTRDREEAASKLRDLQVYDTYADIIEIWELYPDTLELSRTFLSER